MAQTADIHLALFDGLALSRRAARDAFARSSTPPA